MTAEKAMIKELRSSSILDIVNKIRDTSSRNAKIEIVKNAIEYRKGFAEFLQAVYNPFIQYHIKKIPEYTPENTPNTTIERILSRPEKNLGVLSSRIRTGREAEKFLVYLLESLPAEDAKALEMIIERDISAGVTDKSINKASPGLIPEYPCMLASAFDQKLIDRLEFPVLVQTKMDGLRANILVKPKGETEVRGRSGKTLGLDGFFDDVVVRPKKFSYILDGEILVRDTKTGDYLSRKKGNGIVRRYAQGKISEEDRKRYAPEMTVWDYIPLELFEQYHIADTHKTNAPYTVRLQAAEASIRDSEKIRMIDTKEVNTFGEIEEIMLDRLNAGLEGVVVKARESLWRDGRPKDHIKMKDVRECELFIIGLEEGKGRFAGKLGAWRCESACGGLEVSVGSGFSEKERDEFFDEKFIGRVVSVKFNEVIQRKGSDKKSLFLPIYSELRQDKSEADTLETIERS